MTEATETVETEAVETETVEPAEEAATEKTESQPEGKTVAAGAEEKVEEDPAPYWPVDWREKAAEHISAGDEKVYKKELKQLERYTDPTAIAAKTRELEARFSKGGLVKIPGKDASEEDIATYKTALGIPENHEDYYKDVKLDNDAVIGEADKPVVDHFAQWAWSNAVPPDAFTSLLNTYYAREEAAAAEIDEMDEAFHNESVLELKEDYGPAYKRHTSAVSTLFTTAPGGLDMSAENSLYARLMGGRTSDGKLIGDDPDTIRFFAALARDANPEQFVTTTDGGEPSGKSIDSELKEIAKMRSTDKKAYFSDEVQLREQELLEAQSRIRARA
jgi:hypothetical protein